MSGNNKHVKGKKLLPYSDYCKSDREKMVFKLLIEGKRQGDVADIVGIHPRTVRKIKTRVMKRAEVMGGVDTSSNIDVKIPESFAISKVSSLYRLNDDGETEERLKWVQTRPEVMSMIEIAKGIAEAMNEQVEGLAKPTPAPTVPLMNDMLTVYPVADAHVGLFSWHEETGEDYDLKKVESLMKQAVDYLVSKADPTETALIAGLGDITHTDNSSNRTERSGNALDVDSRWAKTLRVAVDIMIYYIDTALTKHGTVHVINEKGNHDDRTSHVVAMMLDAYYRQEPRVTVDTSPMAYHYYRFGKCLFGTHHGDRVKPTDLESIMATDRAKDWGETEFRYWLTGHIHHETKKELRGCTVESFRTLAAKDEWHFASGYRSKRNMVAMSYHKDTGERSRWTWAVEMDDGRTV